MIIYNYAITEFDVQRDLLLSELSRRGYSDATILGYKEYLNCVKKYFQQKQKSIFTNEDTSEFLKNYCDDHKLSEDSIRKCRAIIRRFDSQCEGSEWIQTIGFRKNTVNIPECYISIINRYLDNCLDTGNKPITVNRKRQYTEEFVSRLNELGCNSLQDMTPSNVLKACTAFDFTGSWPFISQFLSYLFNEGIIERDLSTFVPKHKRCQKLPSIYSMEEISKAENTISKSSPNGIRDLAIMMLASRCGLRCGDIVLLKIDSISMDTGLLSITQQKTEEPLSMILPAQVVNIIRNYISDHRPDSSEKALFLSSLPPFSALTPAAVYRVVSNAFKQAGVNTVGKKKGPHTLRASMASSMVNDDVPYDAVRRILGHRNPQTIKHYASIHVEKLREYSLTPPKASGNFLAILKGGN